MYSNLLLGPNQFKLKLTFFFPCLCQGEENVALTSSGGILLSFKHLHKCFNAQS